MSILCKWCDEPIDNQDPRVPEGFQPMHHECFIRTIVGSVGHQQKICSCYGGNFEDPPELTKRQAATKATFLFLKAQNN